MKKHSPMPIDDDFECMNIQVDDPQKWTLLRNKPLQVHYNIPKDLCYKQEHRKTRNWRTIWRKLS